MTFAVRLPTSYTDHYLKVLLLPDPPPSPLPFHLKDLSFYNF